MQVHPMRGRRGLVVLLVAALLAALVVAARWDSYQPSTGGELTGAVPQDSCADVLVLGVDGNAEQPAAGSGLTFGRTVEAFVAPYVGTVKTHRTVALARLSATMPALRTLTEGAKGSSLLRASVKRWAAPVPDAVTRTLARINGLAAKCSSQQFVLVGYAQGAAVVHRSVLRLAPAVRQRISGTVMISDPFRVLHSGPKLTGSPAAPRWRQGVLAAAWASPADVPPPPAAGRNWTVCTAHDVACDRSNWSLSDAARIARSYTRSGLAAVVSDVVNRTLLWPTASPRSRVVSFDQGKPSSLQLTVDVSPGTDTVFTPLTALPAGLSLTESGLITGTPSEPGTTVVGYAVQGSDPPTTPHDGTVSITVSPLASALDSGGQTTCETRSDGTAWCWGRNDYGQFGSGVVGNTATPTQVMGTGFDSISTSGSATCAVKLDHTLWCWGLNDFGQTAHTPSNRPILKPTQVGTATNWSQVSVSWSHACGLRASGALYCWGQGLRGQLGTGTTVKTVAVPQRVGSAADWADVVTAGWHTCALREDSTAWCWGSNSMGELGIGSTDRALVPTQVPGTWTELSASWGGSCGVGVDGTLACWGRNRRGEVGDGTKADRTSPVAVGAGTRWIDVASAEQSTCALDVSGQTWCWGANTYGQTGPDQPGVESPRPRLVPDLPRAARLTSGWLFFCGVDANGDERCWGNDEAGSLGEVGPTPSPSPTSTTTPARPVSTATVITGAPARRLDRLTPAQIADEDLADRPPVTARERTGTAALQFKVMTYNVLGSQHTAPGADASEFAPGRVRAEWTATLLRARNESLVGAQEIQPNQVEAIGSAVGGLFAVVPGNVHGYAAAPQSVLLRQPTWTVVWEGSITIPFMDGWRPQPVLRVRDQTTGRQLYFINVHFSPGGRQAQREKAMDILVAEVKKLSGDGLPMVVTGDFNARDWTFCQITTRTKLVAAQGGSSGSPCHPPATRRIDWIFGSGGTFSRWSLLNTPEVDLTTDHTVQDARFSIG